MNISNILSGLNKTLNVINKILPMYEKIKPVLNNSKDLLNIINNKEVKEIKKVDNNLPTFFQ